MTIQVRQPSRATLRKYGLDYAAWLSMLNSQNGVCAVCGKVPSSGMLVIDHFHAKGFRRMKAEQKRQHVRGLCCNYCNRWRVGKLDLTWAAAVLSYLEKHKNRSQSNAG